MILINNPLILFKITTNKFEKQKIGGFYTKYVTKLIELSFK